MIKAIKRIFLSIPLQIQLYVFFIFFLQFPLCSFDRLTGDDISKYTIYDEQIPIKTDNKLDLAMLNINPYTERPKRDVGSGTGFLWEHLKLGTREQTLYLVTNKHVAGLSYDLDRETINPEGGPYGLRITFQLTSDYRFAEGSIRVRVSNPEWIPHPDPNIDLSVLRIDELIERTNQYLQANPHPKNGKHFTVLNSSLNRRQGSGCLVCEDFTGRVFSAEDEVLIMGFPGDGFEDVSIFKNFPSHISGRVTHRPNLGGKKNPHFKINTSTLPGSSGSPVIFSKKRTCFCCTTNRVHKYFVGILCLQGLHSANLEFSLNPMPRDEQKKRRRFDEIQAQHLNSGEMEELKRLRINKVRNNLEGEEWREEEQEAYTNFINRLEGATSASEIQDLEGFELQRAEYEIRFKNHTDLLEGLNSRALVPVNFAYVIRADQLTELMQYIDTLSTVPESKEPQASVIAGVGIGSPDLQDESDQLRLTLEESRRENGRGARERELQEMERRNPASGSGAHNTQT